MADTNSDGILVEAEYCTFQQYTIENWKAAHGSAPDYDEEAAKNIYAVLN